MLQINSIPDSETIISYLEKDWVWLRSSVYEFFVKTFYKDKGRLTVLMNNFYEYPLEVCDFDLNYLGITENWEGFSEDVIISLPDFDEDKLRYLFNEDEIREIEKAMVHFFTDEKYFKEVAEKSRVIFYDDDWVTISRGHRFCIGKTLDINRNKITLFYNNFCDLQFSLHDFALEHIWIDKNWSFINTDIIEGFNSNEINILERYIGKEKTYEIKESIKSIIKEFKRINR